jgi:hypothetical protein
MPSLRVILELEGGGLASNDDKRPSEKDHQ